MSEHRNGSLYGPQIRRIECKGSKTLFKARMEYSRLRDDSASLFLTTNFVKMFFGKVEPPIPDVVLHGRLVEQEHSVSQAVRAIGPHNYRTTLQNLHDILRRQILEGADLLDRNTKAASIFIIPNEGGKDMMACVRCMADGHWRLYANPITDAVRLTEGEWLYTIPAA